MKVIVNVYLKDGILDPQGKATEHALSVMGFKEVKEVRIGKQIVLDLEESNESKALEEADAMAQKLLVNQVIEDYKIEIA